MQIGINPSLTISRIQFPIQLIVSRIIHHSQGLTLDHLAFDPTSVTKHGLTYIALLKVHWKKIVFIFLLLIYFFQMDHLVREEMFRLITNSQYKLAIVYLKSYRSKIIIVKYFNTRSLTLHFEDILAYSKLLASHILCLNERRIKIFHLNSKFYNVLSQKFHILSCYDEHGTMVLYDDNVSLTKKHNNHKFWCWIYHRTF
jgi:hypothetical protein